MENKLSSLRFYLFHPSLEIRNHILKAGGHIVNRLIDADAAIFCDTGTLLDPVFFKEKPVQQIVLNGMTKRYSKAVDSQTRRAFHTAKLIKPTYDWCWLRCPRFVRIKWWRSLAGRGQT